jgi:hypothetical protein
VKKRESIYTQRRHTTHDVALGLEKLLLGICVTDAQAHYISHMYVYMCMSRLKMTKNLHFKIAAIKPFQFIPKNKKKLNLQSKDTE